jgi:hypothetical protein
MSKIKFPVKIDPRRPALVVDANGEAVSAPHDDFDEKFNGDWLSVPPKPSPMP